MVEHEKHIEKPSWDTRMIEKALLVIVAVIGAVGVIYTITIFVVILPVQNVSFQVFAGLVGALTLQVLLVNTIFIWKIMQRAEQAFASLPGKNNKRR